MISVTIPKGSKSGSYTLAADNFNIISVIPLRIAHGLGSKPEITNANIYDKTVTITSAFQQITADANILCNLFYIIFN